jgi:lysophospholipase L1-like esterase
MGTTAKQAGDYVENDKPWHRLQAMKTFGLDILFIAFGINEEITGTSKATYKANMQTIITAAKSVNTDVVLVMHPNNGGSNSDANVAAAISELSVENTVPWIDLRPVLGTYAEANAAGDWFDIYHPSAQGYGLIARTEAKAIAALSN